VLVAAATEDDLTSLTLDTDIWQQATAIEVPLSAQNVSRPILPETKIKAVTARALHNGRQLALMVEWSDETQNDQTLRVQDFRDSVAVQYAHAEGQPFFCMGQLGGNVNIWHWKADWQAAIAARQSIAESYPNMHVDYSPFAETAEDDIYQAEYSDANYLTAQAAGNPLAAAQFQSPVEDLNAGGFGSLTAQSAAGQNVQGSGGWVDGRWRVIFTRDLDSTAAEDVSFAADKVYSIAFAAWDGANGERNGAKSTSQWLSLQLGKAAAASASQIAVLPPTAGRAAMPPLAIAAIFVITVVLVAGIAIYKSL
jgi:DMSO reductase family type II enzyme heme b subunit